MFHPIDWETWPRRDHFNYYYNQIKCRYTLTAHIDIAPLREFQKQRQLRFFPLMLYAIMRAVNENREFRMSFDGDGRLGYWDVVVPCYTVFHEEDKTFSERLLPYKQVSGVVGDVDEAGQHGLISLLHYKVLPWTSDELFVGLPDGLSGKENTRLILEKAALQQQKAEAAAYCATYAFDGVKAGEAFLASYSEMSRICKNYLSINKSLRQINNADIFIVCRAYWTSSEKQAEKAMSASMPGIVSNDVIAKWAKLYVCPVIAF